MTVAAYCTFAQRNQIPYSKLTGYLTLAAFAKWMLTHPLGSLHAGIKAIQKGWIQVVHQYKSNGYEIVLDVNSGSVHVVDELAYDLIKPVEALIDQGMTKPEDITAHIMTKAASASAQGASQTAGADANMQKEAAGRIAAHTQEEIAETVGELLSLKEADMLYTKDIYEPYIDSMKKRETVVKALCLHIAHDCNLACRYCFAEEGEYHGRRALMSFEVGKKALDFLVANSGNRVNLEVDFFGGEPLMNWDVVKELVLYGRSLEKEHNKRFRFTMTTNGLLLDEEKLTFINQEMGNLVLSLDGRKEVHDRMRPHRGGQGSYDEIVPKFLHAAESRDQMNYYVRGTFTRYNLDFAEDVLHVADLGFQQISVEPVVADADEDYAIREEDVPAIEREYDRLAEALLERRRAGKPVNFFHFMIDLEGGPCVAKRLSGCGSGCEYLAVTPWGDFYPCHQFVGQEEFLMGNVDTGIVRPEVRQQFQDCNVYTKEKCKDCFAKF